MPKKTPIDYKDAGVDVVAGYNAVKLMKKYVQETYNENVLGQLGSFGGLYALDDRDDGDVLVAGTDGVGTKLKYSFALDKHDTIGIDCVAMCANDIVCQGAKPLFFLDYIAAGKLIPEQIASIVKGVAEGCKQSGCALIGGETAEMPGFYPTGEYDMAGFCVGIVKRNKIINGADIDEGDALVGLASSGIHSNGYSLVRKLFPAEKDSLSVYDSALGKTYGEAVLAPTKIYVKTVLSLLEKFDLKGIAHITGGGFIENIPRILPKGLAAEVYTASYPLPALFRLLWDRAGISEEKMYNTFNMGIGMVLCVKAEDAAELIKEAEKLGECAYLIGNVVAGEGVKLC